MEKKIKILHVDDEIETLNIVKEILEKQGYEVISVNGGSQALKEIKMNDFNLIILDIMMPKISGWQLFSKMIKIKPKHKVIFLSVLDLKKEKINELLDSGARAYIKKPFDLDDFVKTVKNTLES
jgi:two-component system, OmpR family, lantibiotic biosynthesis response regulator NisR/SpaR